MFKALTLAAAILALTACGPKECKEAKPAIAATSAALKANKFSDAKAEAEKLAKAVANTTKDIGILEMRTGELIKALDKASKPPASPEQGAKDAADLKGAIERWNTAAGKVCN